MAAEKHVKLSLEAVQALAEGALQGAGASADNAPSVARSCVIPEAEGLSSVGLSHLLDYCRALEDGRVHGAAQPRNSRPTPVLFQADARGGFPPPAFDACFDDFCTAVGDYGIGLLAIGNGYTCGALGYYAGRIAERDLAALAATNAGPAMLAASGSTRAVFSTNPMAFAVPRSEKAPLLIDQSSSHSAYVNIQAAAAADREIPAGWALDRQGLPTTDPQEAMQGVLLAFGGARGANVALMVELLAAGFTGSNWSLDAPAFNAGNTCPGVGLCIIGINPALLDTGFAARCDAWLERLAGDYGAYIPGARRAANRERAGKQGLDVAADTVAALEGYARG